MCYTSITMIRIYFNPRSHKGSDDVGKLQGRRDVDFNPRSHKGSDRCGKAPRSARCGFQSTLPQGERPISLCSSVRPVNISIHAPTRGATVLVHSRIFIEQFQSTLPQGERQEIRNMIGWSMGFQSTLPQGERQCRIWIKQEDAKISIHAPTRGATVN